MDKGRLLKDLLYGQLKSGTDPIGRPCLRYQDSCKRDLQAARINVATWEVAALDDPGWSHAVRSGQTRAEKVRSEHGAPRPQKQKTLQTPGGLSCMNPGI